MTAGASANLIYNHQSKFCKVILSSYISKKYFQLTMLNTYERRQSYILLLFLIGFYVTNFSTVYYFLFSLPSATHTDSHSDFSVRQTRYYLENITSYGVRHVGSKSNEEETPRYLTNVLHRIMERSKELRYEVEVTRNSGEREVSTWIK